MSLHLDYEALNEQVNRAVNRRRMAAKVVFFVLSLFMFVLFMIIGWGMVLSGNAEGAISALGSGDANPVFGGMFMLSMGWLTTLVFQGLALIFDTPAGEKSIRREVVSQQVGEQLLQQMGAGEKPKRDDAADRLAHADEMVELTEDGELIPLEEQQRRAQSR